MSSSSFDIPSDNVSTAKAVEAFNFNDFEAEGESILASARAEAQAIKNSIEAEKKAALEAAAAQGKQEGYNAGFEEGKAAGITTGQQQGREEIMPQITPAIGCFTEAAEKLEGQIDELVHQAQCDFIELVKVVALKVIHKYLENDSDVIARSMDSISEYIVHKNSLVISVNPEDKEILTQWLRDNKPRFDKLKALKINGDESISRGGCTISTPEGGIDVSIESAIEAIVEEL